MSGTRAVHAKHGETAELGPPTASSFAAQPTTCRHVEKSRARCEHPRQDLAHPLVDRRKGSRAGGRLRRFRWYQLLRSASASAIAAS